MRSPIPVTPPNKTFGGIGEFLRSYCEILVTNFPILGVVVLVVGIPYLLLAQWIASTSLAEYATGTSSSSRSVSVEFATVGIFSLAALAAYQLLSILLASVVSDQVGILSVGSGNALRWALVRVPSVIAYSMVAFLGIVLGTLFLVLPGIYLMLRLFPVPFVALFEPDAAPLRRSWELTRDRTLEIFLAFLGLLVLLFVGSTAVGLATTFIPMFPGFRFLLELVNLFFGCAAPTVFWLLLYGWFREETTRFHIALSEI